MRSVFTVDLPIGINGAFPSDEEIREVVRTYGREPTEISQMEDESEKLAKYKELSTELIQEMPELRAATHDNIIFYGFIVTDNTPFMITRVVTGQITFRLLQPDLSLLLTATEWLVRKVIKSRLNDKFLSVSSQKIVVYERGHENIILKGRVIPNAFRETLQTDRKDFLLTVIPLILVIPATYVLIYERVADPLVVGTLERLSTALLTTALVSALGLFQTFWTIQREHLVSWKFTSGEGTSEYEA